MGLGEEECPVGAGTVAGLTVIYLTLWQGAPAARRTAAAPMPEAVKAAPKGGTRGKTRVRAAVKEAAREPARIEVARVEVARAEVAAEVAPSDKDKPVERARAGRAAQARAVTPGEIVYLPGPVVKKPVWIAPPEVKRAESELIALPEVVAQVATPLPAVVKPGMAGLWVYLKPSRVTAAANSYPPEFIELTLRETGGVVKGRYLARYQVADRAISPEVRFQFEGAAGEEAGEFVWSGNGGAKGEVRLRRVGDHQMQVSWHTTEAGAEVGLMSGTAMLIRRQTP
ncbi:MAG: hypothetical protein IPJ98_11075 [Bryobacterales bacterium]|nr:hypothetical protein [Bryobacterales bacterium]